MTGSRRRRGFNAEIAKDAEEDAEQRGRRAEKSISNGDGPACR
jgi:hypothetical protein